MSLHLTLGPMKAGKSDSIIRLYNKLSSIGKKIFIITHIYDENRIGKINAIRTHNGIYLEAYSTNSLLKILNNEEYKSADIIIIEEAQFFLDLKIFLQDQLSDLKINKEYYVFGLSGDTEQEKFGHILDIIPICDSITHLTAFCNICNDGTPAPFTKILSKNKKEQILIGDYQYIPVCRKHLHS
jgi:thymidine kinase